MKTDSAAIRTEPTEHAEITARAGRESGQETDWTVRSLRILGGPFRSVFSLRSPRPLRFVVWRSEAMAKGAKFKTNAMRALDARGIPYIVATYPDTIHSAAYVAQLLRVPA